nr:uncharacterized protein LOC113807462 [Penaeus vannamei]
MHFSFLTAALMAAVVAAAPEAQYGYQATKCQPEIQYVTRTETVPKYVTTTHYQTHTQYKTQYQPRYVTQTQQVPHYVTRTQTVPEYITQTVPQYVTRTQYQTQHVTVTKPCPSSGGYSMFLRLPQATVDTTVKDSEESPWYLSLRFGFYNLTNTL